MSVISRNVINANEGQFGRTVFDNISSDTVTIYDDYPKNPFRYLLTPTSTDRTIFLPTISNTSNLKEKSTLFVQNTSTEFNLSVSNNKEIISLLKPGYSSSFVARTETNSWSEIVQTFGTCIGSVTENNFLTWKDTCWVSAPLSVNVLTDVNIVSPQDNDIIIYDSANQMWVNTVLTLTASGTFEGGVSVNGSQVGIFYPFGSEQQTIDANLKTVYEGSPGEPTVKITYDNIRGGLEIRNSVDTEIETLFSVKDTGGDNIFNVSRTHLSGLGGQIPDTDSFSICMGTGATISSGVSDAIILGDGGSTMDNAIAIKGSVSGSTDSIAIGVSSVASGSRPSIAFGRNTTASGAFSISMGDVSTASNTDSISLNITGGTASGESSISIGHNSTASGDNSICISHGGTASGNRSILFSSVANVCTRSDSVCIVANSTLSDKAVSLRGTARNGVSIGVSSSATGVNATSIGRSAASGNNTTLVVGTPSLTMSGADSTLIASTSSISASRTVCVAGRATGNDSVAFFGVVGDSAVDMTGTVGQSTAGTNCVVFGGRLFRSGGGGTNATGNNSIIFSGRNSISGDNSIFISPTSELDFAAAVPAAVAADRMVQISGRTITCSVPGTILLSSLTSYSTATSKNSINFSRSPNIANIENRYAKRSVEFFQVPKHPASNIIDQTTTALRTWFDQGIKTTTGNVTNSTFSVNRGIATGNVFYINTRLIGTHTGDGRVWSYYYLTNVKNIAGTPTFSSSTIKRLESNISLNSGDPLVFTGVANAIQFGITTTGLTASDTIKWNMFLDFVSATP
jgi:hypothetical protein